MPEPHEPNGEQDEEFRPSIPDLTPNLSDTPIADEEPHEHIPPELAGWRGFQPKSWDKEVVRAEGLREKHVAWADEVAERKRNEVELQKEYSEYTQAISILDKMLKNTHPEWDKTSREHISYTLNRALQERSVIWESLAKVQWSTGEHEYQRNIEHSQRHLEQNREAYENEAVNDYNHARAVEPERYPEPLTYGDNYQPQPLAKSSLHKQPKITKPPVSKERGFLPCGVILDQPTVLKALK